MSELFLILLLIFVPSPSFAAEAHSKQPFPSDQEVEEFSDKIDEINAKLEKPVSRNEKAELLYQKAMLELTFSWVTSMRSATEFLLEAIELEPKNKKYRDYLRHVYYGLWEKRDFNGKDQLSKDFLALREEVRRTVLDTEGRL